MRNALIVILNALIEIFPYVHFPFVFRAIKMGAQTPNHVTVLSAICNVIKELWSTTVKIKGAWKQHMRI